MAPKVPERARLAVRGDARLTARPCADPPSFAVVIPAYDCAATVGAAVRDVTALGLPVVVVDDGSTDETAAIAAAAGAAVVRNPDNRGKGESLRRGMRHCGALGYSHVVTMDGDGQHLAGEIDALVAAARGRPRAIIVGQRIVDPGNVAARKLFGNRFANRWVAIACGESIPDTQSGFRVYPIADTCALGCRSRRFAFETEVLIRAVQAGIAVVSVPVDVYYPPPHERRSHYRPWADTVRIIFVVLGLIFRVY